MKTWPTKPVHDYDAPNQGTVLVGFEVKIPSKATSVLTVSLTPDKSQIKDSQKLQSLEKWPKSLVGSK